MPAVRTIRLMPSGYSSWSIVFAQLVAVLALDAARDAAAARVVRHQHEVAAGERDERGQRRALVAALFLLDLDDAVPGLRVSRVLDAARLRAVDAFAEVACEISLNGRKPWRSSP